MKTRNILQPVKSQPPPTAEPVEELTKDLDDAQIFDLPPVKQEKPPVEMVNEPPPPETPKPKKKYAHLEEARKKSLESRRRKAQEKKQLMSEVDEYKEKLEFERLAKKYNKSQPAPAPEPVIEREVPVQKSVASTKPEHDMSGSMIDYDRLIGGVADRLTKQNEYFSQLERDIRADERKRAEATYQEQLKSWEQQQHRQYRREQAYNALSSSHRRNTVFDRTAKLRESYTQRYKDNWYSNY